MTAAAVELIWADTSFVAKRDIGADGGLPVWLPQQRPDARGFRISGARARAVELHNRPERETARGILTGWQTLPSERTANPRVGTAGERETEPIAAWRDRRD